MRTFAARHASPKVTAATEGKCALVGLERIDGTFRHAWPGTVAGIPFDPARRVRATVWLAGASDDARDAGRAAELGGEPVRERTYETRAAFRKRTNASERLFEELDRYCAAHGIAIVGRHWRSVVVSGTLADLVTAFQANVDVRTSPHGDPFRHREGWLHLPQHLARNVRGIFGLHQWYREGRVAGATRDRVPLEPGAVERYYDFPKARGAGQTIAILAYAATYRASDYALAMHRLGVTRSEPIVKHVDGERAAHHPDTGADLEAATDVQVAAALAPEARIVVYETPHDERGCLDAIRAAIFDDDDAPAVLSISYGIVERLWTRAALTLLDDLFVAAALVGVTVFVASGDNGAELDGNGRPHANAPASSPFVLACGATRLEREANHETREIAWHRTGGGFGRAPVPLWQTHVRASAERHGVDPGRGVPDVSAQCDPGYPVYFHGTELSMHGTSTIAPMWAALAARIDESTTAAFGSTQTIGFFAPLLYASAAHTMRPVTAGRNDFFEAHGVWNPCAGLGSPRGAALERALLGT